MKVPRQNFALGHFNYAVVGKMDGGGIIMVFERRSWFRRVTERLGLMIETYLLSLLRV